MLSFQIGAAIRRQNKMIRFNGKILEYIALISLPTRLSLAELSTPAVIQCIYLLNSYLKAKLF